MLPYCEREGLSFLRWLLAGAPRLDPWARHTINSLVHPYRRGHKAIVEASRHVLCRHMDMNDSVPGITDTGKGREEGLGMYELGICR